MTYKELQQALKQLRNEGKIPANFKLNQKKVILQAMWDEMNVKPLSSREISQKTIEAHISGKIFSRFANAAINSLRNDRPYYLCPGTWGLHLQAEVPVRPSNDISEKWGYWKVEGTIATEIIAA